ncbi:hypothetical protein ACFFX0_08295 [Citricoccus parietis]|uniref:Secreted protein n=1 Tax=Citricoccus parietis TaxID=592307 RepID=A0ABV5FXN8_9MICC
MFCAIALMLPVPGSTVTREAPAPEASPAGTVFSTDCWAWFCSPESSVVVISSPPRFSSCSRDSTSGPKASLARISRCT